MVMAFLVDYQMLFQVIPLFTVIQIWYMVPVVELSLQTTLSDPDVAPDINHKKPF
jgi:hypothetical protein